MLAVIQKEKEREREREIIIFLEINTQAFFSTPTFFILVANFYFKLRIFISNRDRVIMRIGEDRSL